MLAQNDKKNIPSMDIRGRLTEWYYQATVAAPRR